MRRPAPPRHVPPLAPDTEAALVVCPALGPDWPASGLGPVAQVLSQLPAPGQLRPGSWVALDDRPAAPSARGLGLLLRRRRTAPRVHLAVRCTALLAHGYEQVCADARGAAFGRVPTAASPARSRPVD
jgi:hypothetical protein